MPYTNVPEDLWAKMDKCVKDVQDKQGVSKESAVAICYDSVVGGKSLLDALKAQGDRMLVDFSALKIGARHSKDDLTAIQAIHDSAKMLGATCGEGDGAGDDGEGGKSARLIHAKSLTDAPNLRNRRDLSCGNCKYFKTLPDASKHYDGSEVATAPPQEPNGVCQKFDFETRPAWVCDAWEVIPDSWMAEQMAKSAKDLLITFGDAVKSLGDVQEGHLVPIGGYLVRWGSAKEKDIEGQYFTKNTYLGAHDGNGMDTFINHGVPFMKGADDIFDLHLHPVETQRDQVGLFAKTVLDLHNQFEKVLYELSQRGALKWSSGTAPNLVRVKRDGRITQWPIVDASLTPVPAEWRPTNRVLPLKSYVTESNQWSADGWLKDFAKATADKAAREIPDDLKREAELLKVRVGATAAP